MALSTSKVARRIPLFSKRPQGTTFILFHAKGSQPLLHFRSTINAGQIRRVTDELLSCLVISITGYNVSRAYIQTPKLTGDVLGITLPILVMVVRNLRSFFTFEIEIASDENELFAFRFSTFSRISRVHKRHTTLPMRMNSGWNRIIIDVASLLRIYHGERFGYVAGMIVNANCHLRSIAFTRDYTSSVECFNEKTEAEICTAVFPKSSGRDYIGHKF